MPDFSRLPPQVFAHCTSKQANVLALPAMKSVGLGLGKLLRATKGGAGRYTELLRGTKLQNLVRKHEMASELGNMADPPGVIKEIMRRVSGGGLQGQIGDNAADVARQLQHQALGEAAKVYGTRAGTAGAGLLGGSAALQNALSKQSAALPEPTCRGTTKKVTMPSDSKQQPDLDPEGVQMSAQDYRTQKEARLGSLLKLLAKGVYKTPRSLKALGLGGGGGYIAGRQHGHQMGLDDGREDAAKTLTDLFQKKQAFMGLGALAGMATAPNKEEEDLSIGRGALRGVGTGLGVGIGGATGALAGRLGGAGLGAVLGALARGKDQSLGAAMGRGALGGSTLGMLAGGIGGGVYGGYKGNKATKALLDKTAPISDKKKDKKDDDKDVKEAAAAVYTRLLQNNPTIKSAVGPMQPLASAAKAKMLSPATPKPAMPQVARPQAAMPQLPAANDPARKAYERHTIGRMYHQHGAPAARYEHFQKGVDPKAFAHFTPEQRKMLDKDVMQRLYNQHGGAEGFMDAAQMPMQ